VRVHVTAMVAPVLLLAAPALSDPAPSPAATAPTNGSAPKDKTVDAVTVNGAQQTYKSSIDRKSYAIGTDIQSTTGAVSDVLRNVPGLNVDMQGNVTLRGQGVTIMVDGKPTSQFKGEAGAQALQSIPADQYERVEVITNPSAEFRPDGAGGIINLISKKNRKPGYSTSLKANYGSDGRYNGAISGGYNSRKLSVTANLSDRHEVQKVRSDRSRTFTDDSALANSRDVVVDDIGLNILSGTISVDYDATDKDRLSLETTGTLFKIAGDEWDHFEGRDTAGALTDAFDQFDHFHESWKSAEVQGTWLHKFGDDHELKVNVSQERDTDLTAYPNHLTQSLPAPADIYEVFRNVSATDQTEVKVDYSRPMPDGAKLKAGYELTLEKDVNENFGSSGPSMVDQAVVAARTHTFHLKQAVNAGYVSYERSFGDLTVLPGLRLEQVDLQINQVTAAIRASNHYFRAYPTLHLSYKLDDEQKLTGSYSRRVNRPRGSNLDPYPTYGDPFTYYAGNPNLKPEVTDSYELGWERSHKGANLQATLYLRDTHDDINNVARDLGGGVVLNTQDNIGHRRNGGVELVASGKLSKTLSYNASVDAYWNELTGDAIDASGVDRSGWTYTARGTLSWQATPKDFVQLTGFAGGRQLTPQGYQSARGLINIGYRHKFSDRLSGVVTARDAAGTMTSQRMVVDTASFHQVREVHQNTQAVYVGLTYVFGGGGKAPPKEQGFDFGGGGGGGPH
jgi:outer membrane receptor protein involved in Fe transport